MTPANIRAWKPAEDPGYITPCAEDDPNAKEFRVDYAGMGNSSCYLKFDSLYRARETVSALNAVFEAGKKAKLAEVREFLGV